MSGFRIAATLFAVVLFMGGCKRSAGDNSAPEQGAVTSSAPVAEVQTDETRQGARTPLEPAVFSTTAPSKEESIRIETRQKFYPNGELRSEHVVKVMPDGSFVNHGPYRVFFVDGQIQLEGHYVDGERDGLLIGWRPDGSKRGQANWKMGFKHGKVTTVFENGQTTIEETFAGGNRHGLYSEWNEEGRLISQGEYVKGKRHGKWLDDSGDGPVETVWDAGELVSQE